MEENNGSTFGTLTLLISDIALLGAAYMVFSIRGNSETLSIGVLPWIIMAIVSFALYRLFLRHERTLPQAALFLAASYIVTITVLLIFFVRLPGVLPTLIALVFWSAPQFRIYTATRTPPTLEKLTIRLEGIVIFLLFLLLFTVSLDRPFIHIVPCAASMFLCLAALIVMRTSRSSAGEGSGKRGAAAILAFFLLIGATTAVFLLFAFASLGDTVAEGVAALIRGIKILSDFLTRILNWLVSLLPTPDYSGGLQAEMVVMEDGAGVEEEMISGGEIIPIILICAVAVAIAAFVIVFVIRSRRDTLGGKRKLKVSGIKRRRLNTRVSLFRRFYESLRFFGYSILYRNTPQGVFVQIERWGRSRRCARTPFETQRNYLARLSANVPGLKNNLIGLADTLDACWYGDPGLSQLSRRELIKLRKSFSIAHLNLEVHNNTKNSVY